MHCAAPSVSRAKLIATSAPCCAAPIAMDDHRLAFEQFHRIPLRRSIVL
jgi:hypothetical protein